MNEPMTPETNAAGEVLVLGAGLAGSFAARALAQRGWSVRVIDRQPVGDDGPASYAPRVALLQPKISDQDDPPGQRLREGFAIARAMIEANWADDPRVAWRPCGAFHASHHKRGRLRLVRYLDQFGQGESRRWIERHQTQDELGVFLEFPGVVLDSAGVLRPGGLCAALLRHPGIEVSGRTAVTGLERVGDGWRVEVEGRDAITATRVVVANAMGALLLAPTAHLDLRPVRGQALTIPADVVQRALWLKPGGLRRALCYGGYLLPATGQSGYTLGASFVPGDTGTDWREDERWQITDRLRAMFSHSPDWWNHRREISGWAGVRVTTPTRLPYAGPVERDGETLPGLYASLGHGSHGICSAAISAKHLAESMT